MGRRELPPWALVGRAVPKATSDGRPGRRDLSVMPISSRARRVEAELRRRGSPGAAAGASRFFKTGPGEYGEGDKFFGLAAAQIYEVARAARDLTLDDVEQLLESSWHESRLVALVVLSHRYPRGDSAMQQKIYRLYLRRTDRINYCDLVDVSAPAD